MAPNTDLTNVSAWLEAQGDSIGQKRRDLSSASSPLPSPTKRINFSPPDDMSAEEVEQRSPRPASQKDPDRADQDSDAAPGSRRSSLTSVDIFWPPPSLHDSVTGEIILPDPEEEDPRPNLYGSVHLYASITKSSPEEKKRFSELTIFGNNIDFFLVAEFWPRLKSSIMDLAFCGFPYTVPLDTLDEASVARAKSISPEWEKFMTNGAINYALPFSTGWIYRVLYDKLFSSECEDKWKDGPWQHFAKLQQATRSRVNCEPTEFNDNHYSSRHRMARSLYTLFGDHSDHKRLVDLLQSDLRPFIQNTPESSKDLIIGFLNNIAEHAIKLDLLFVSSQYRFEIEMHDPKTGKWHSFLPDLGTMDVMMRFHPWEYPGDFPVDLICAPRVRMMGTLDPVPGNLERVTSRGWCQWESKLEVGASVFPERCEFEHFRIMKKRMLGKLEAARLAAIDKGEEPRDPRRIISREEAAAELAEIKATYKGPLASDTRKPEQPGVEGAAGGGPSLGYEAYAATDEGASSAERDEVASGGQSGHFKKSRGKENTHNKHDVADDDNVAKDDNAAVSVVMSG